MPSLVVSYSHQDADIDETINAIDGALAVYVCALNDGVDNYLVGRPSTPVYRTWNEKR
jgi:glutamate-1-semialdehyde 2,1-aminomutase